MWYVYREFADGECAEDAYDNVQQARRAQLFIQEHFDPETISLSLDYKISPMGGRLYREPTTQKRTRWRAWSWLSTLFRFPSRNRFLSR